MTGILDPGWEDRVKMKVTTAATLSGLASSYASVKAERSLLRDVPRMVAGYSGAMAVFCGVQEGLRAVRGQHDALNSAVAGAIAGGLTAGYYQGPQYRLVGAVVWGPVCGILHVLNSILQPRFFIEDFLIGEGLLDPCVADRRPKPLSSASDVYRHIRQQSSMDELLADAERVRTRELQQVAGQPPPTARSASATITSVPVAGAAAVSSTNRGTSTDVDPTTTGSSSSSSLPWWQRWRKGAGQGETAPASDAGPPAATSSSSSSSSSSKSSASTAAARSRGATATSTNSTDDGDGEFDEEDFKAWLGAQRRNPDRVVITDIDEPQDEAAGSAAQTGGRGSKGAGSSEAVSNRTAQGSGQTWWAWAKSWGSRG